MEDFSVVALDFVVTPNFVVTPDFVVTPYIVVTPDLKHNCAPVRQAEK